MDYNEVALIALGFSNDTIPDRVDLLEALDESLYKESQFFHKRDFTPRLADIRIAKLKALCELCNQLGIDHKQEFKLDAEYSQDSKLTDLVSAYNKAVSHYKLILSQASSACDIIDIYKNWQESYRRFGLSYCRVYENLTQSSLIAPAGKSLVDYVELQKELREKDFSNQARMLYLTLKSHVG